MARPRRTEEEQITASFQITVGLAKKARILAAEMNITRSELYRQAVEKLLESLEEGAADVKQS